MCFVAFSLLWAGVLVYEFCVGGLVDVVVLWLWLYCVVAVRCARPVNSVVACGSCMHNCPICFGFCFSVLFLGCCLFIVVCVFIDGCTVLWHDCICCVLTFVFVGLFVCCIVI